METTFGWKVLSVSEREAIIRNMRGNLIVVSSDSSKGYSFVTEYLSLLSKNYGGHIRAADMLLQKMLGEQYRFVRASERVHRSQLALLSLSCGFGGCGDGMDCDETGRLQFRWVPCPIRSFCPFNGFGIKSRKGFSCCNPIYETPLTPKQTEIAELMVNTGYAYKDIAELMNISEGRARNLAYEVFAMLGVCDRQELTVFLKERRLI